MPVAVHYAHWSLRPGEVEQFVAGPVAVATDHPSEKCPLLAGESRAGLAEDLMGDGAVKPSWGSLGAAGRQAGQEWARLPAMVAGADARSGVLLAGR